MLEFLIGGAGGDEQTFAVPGREAADDAGSGDGASRDGDGVGEFGFEDGVEVFGGAERGEAVGVCEGGEDADSGAWEGGEGVSPDGQCFRGWRVRKGKKVVLQEGWTMSSTPIAYFGKLKPQERVFSGVGGSALSSTHSFEFSNDARTAMIFPQVQYVFQKRNDCRISLR